eukprot:GHVP01006843.1.p1 GENE.GHVP01006843.1~~GHVP01006843.1.p1  ORF type:complete len:104 (-),score=14.78 GHVP01006843.1:48-359(-)
MQVSSTWLRMIGGINHHHASGTLENSREIQEFIFTTENTEHKLKNNKMQYLEKFFENQAYNNNMFSERQSGDKFTDLPRINMEEKIAFAKSQTRIKKSAKRLL